jgi:uncharacterized membrane protein YdjX (TVP38/TMEM64 family)
MVDYLSVIFSVFIINIIPAFMPPTWVVLAFAKISDPSFDPFLLALAGAVSSTAGRAVLSYYSAFFRRFFTKDMCEHAEYIRHFFDKKDKELFLGTFIYSLSPFPSNIVFIANGLTKVNYKPIFAGFFLGRLISYFALIVLSQSLFLALSNYFHSEVLTSYLFEVLGVVAAFSILFIDWKKLLGRRKLK